MKKSWVVIANGSEARIFSMEFLKKGLEPVGEYRHPESREKGESLASDRPGAFQSDVNREGYGSYAEPTDPKEYERERFAMELGDMLNSGRVAGEYEQIILIAPPHFHGLLNKRLDEQTARCVAHHINKDYTQVPERELPEKLEPHLMP